MDGSAILGKITSKGQRSRS